MKKETIVLVPAHQGSGDNDYLWDWGNRRGKNLGIQRWLRTVEYYQPDDDPTIVENGYIALTLKQNLTDTLTRSASRVGIIVNS